MLFSKIATREAFGTALVKLADKYPNVVVLDADLSAATKTEAFVKKYPERAFNMGIAEQNMVGFAVGLSLTGYIPFAATFAVFAAGRTFDQVRNSVAYPKANVKIAATHAGLTVGEDGASHQAIEDISMVRAVPNMTIIVPCDAVETEKAVEAAIVHEGPVYLRLGREQMPVVMDENYDFQIGRAVSARRGGDVTIIATGIMVSKALAAAKILANEGIEVEVLNVHTIKPLDGETILRSLAATKKAVVAEEHSVFGGLGGAVAELVVRDGQLGDVKLKLVGIEDQFGQTGTADQLLEAYGLTADRLVSECRTLMSK